MSKYCVITFVGFTNCGKSTLFNYLLKQNLSPVTSKQSTTIENYYYKYDCNSKKMLLIDTPGFQIKRFHKFNQKGNSCFFISIEQADLICVIVNVTRNIFSLNYQKLIKNLCVTKEKTSIILILNKIDLISKEKLLKIIEKISKVYPEIMEIVPISALRGMNIDELIKVLITHYRSSVWGDFIASDENKKTLSKQLLLILRQAVLKFCNQEIPYSLNYEIFHKVQKAKKLYIYVRIIARRPSQIKSLIGSKGVIVRKIIKHCERSCYSFNKTRVKLKLFLTTKK